MSGGILLPSSPDYAPLGLTGATAPSRYVGATASGAPTAGTFAVGDFVIDQTGYVWICTTSGSPGTWKAVGGSFGASGDIFVGTGAGTSEVLAKGSSNTVLAVGGADPSGLEWVNPSTLPVTSTQQSGTTYTFALADQGTVVESTSGSATTFTVPPNSSVAFPTGTIIECFQQGTGQLTIAAGVGVTIDTPTTLIVQNRYGTVSLRKRGTDEWAIGGDC